MNPSRSEGREFRSRLGLETKDTETLGLVQMDLDGLSARGAETIFSSPRACILET